jgi:ABC-2 type transport system permease protein
MMTTYLWALYAREVKRFQKLWLDTIFSPIVSMLLYLAVFGVVIGSKSVAGTNYLAFVYTGLLGMIMVNSSFSNPSFALIISKNLGNIIDLQLVPIKTWGIGIAYALAALTRGVLTLAFAAILTLWFIPGLRIDHPFVLLIVVFLTGLQFGMFGVIFGMWAKNFEALTFVTTFILQPMIFLAGVFYPVADLPHPWNAISLFNPLHHNMNLFRYGFFGYTDINPLISLSINLGLCMVLFVLMQHFTKKTIRPV